VGNKLRMYKLEGKTILAIKLLYIELTKPVCKLEKRGTGRMSSKKNYNSYGRWYSTLLLLY